MALLPSDPQQRQKVLLLLILILGVGYLGYTYVYAPGAAEVAALESRHETLELQNQSARMLSTGAGVDDVQKQLDGYRAQLVAVERLIPSSEELPDLLDAIAMEARRTGVELTLIQPVDATEEEYYTRRVYDVAVRGEYHEIGEFLTNIASLERIITPRGLTLSQPAQQGAADAPARLDAKFSIETYVIPQPDGAVDEAAE